MTEAEIARFEACALAGIAYEVDEHARLDAAVIRRVLCEPIPLPNDQRTGTALRVHIKGTRAEHLATAISGTLDVRDAHGATGGPCPPLIIESCDLLGAVEGSQEQRLGLGSFEGNRGRFTRLHLLDCRANVLRLFRATAQHEVAIGVKPLVRADHAYCIIDASGMSIEGGLSIVDTGLEVRRAGPPPAIDPTPTPLPPPATENTKQPDPAPTDAADGQGTKEPANDAAVRVADIGEPEAPTVESAEATSETVEGAPTSASPLPGEAKAEAPHQSEPEFMARYALNLQEARIGGSVEIEGLKCFGTVNMHLAKVAGDLTVIRSELGSDQHIGWAFDGTNIEVSGDSYFLGVKAMGGLGLVQSRLGTLVIRNIPSGARTELIATVDRPVLSLHRCTIDGDLVVGGSGGKEVNAPVLRGALTASACKVAGSAVLFLLMERSRKARWRLDLQWLDVKGRLLVDIGRSLEKPLTITGILRKTALSFYRGWDLVETRCKDEDGELFCAFLLHRRTGRAVGLTGSSQPIHDMNEQGWLNTSTRRKAMDYLRFFCGYVWGDEGPFTIITGEKDLERWGRTYRAGRDGWDKERTLSGIKPLREIGGRAELARFVKKGTAWRNEPTRSDELLANALQAYDPTVRQGDRLLSATVLYGEGVFQAVFLLSQNGEIEMVMDEPLMVVSRGRVRSETARGQTSSDGSEVPPTIPGSKRWPGKQADVVAGLEAAARPRMVVDLRNARVGLLDDEHGTKWGEHALFLLDGFTYDHVAGTKPVDGGFARPSEGRREPLTIGTPKVADRRNWLDKQYVNAERPTRREFFLQPYEQLASALRSEGYDEMARNIVLDKLRQERKVRRLPDATGKDVERSWNMVRMWFMETFFDHGLFFVKPLVSTIGLLLIGCLFFWIAWNWGALESVPVKGEPGKAAIEVTWQDVTIQLAGTAEKGEPTPARPPDFRSLALDKLIPLVDLSEQDKAYRFKEDASWVWGALLFMYRLFGVVSIWVLIQHLSGGVKRYLEK